MPQEYWHRQTDQPLFPELEWSRPENKTHAGKLLIIGGNAQGFAAPAQAYTAAEQAGVGSVRILLPDSLHKLVNNALLPGEFAPSTPSGSFSRQALDSFLDNAAWADAVLLAGDLGHNSETAIVLESFATKYSQPLTIVNDAADYFLNDPQTIISRPNTILILDLAQLQKLYKASHQTVAITSAIDLMRLVESLHDFTSQHAVNIIMKFQQIILVACGGEVSTTPVQAEDWQIATAAHASVWWLQNPSRMFEALTTSLL